MDKQRSRNDWIDIIGAFANSGQSTKDWCESNGLNINTFKYWKSKLKREKTLVGKDSKTTQWFKLEASEPERGVAIIIGKATIEVSTGFNPSLLKDVIRTLSSLC